MSFRLSGLAIFACGFSLTLGCSSTLQTFTCERNADCVSEGEVGGRCESSRVCSFSDPTCGENGQRFGNHSGEVSNQCVDGDVGLPDASSVEPDVDAGDDTPPDASPAELDADIIVSGPDAGDPTCVNLTLTVIDNFAANDLVRIRYPGSPDFECQPDPVVEGSDTTTECTYCMPLLGTDEIELKGESSVHVEFLVTDCSSTCKENDNNCKFVPTVECSALFIFDTDFTSPPPTP